MPMISGTMVVPQTSQGGAFRFMSSNVGATTDNVGLYPVHDSDPQHPRDLGVVSHEVRPVDERQRALLVHFEER